MTGGGGYRPYLDGLRAVAVYLVVVFHSGSDRFTGGFIGVDVFFVLSGFLVTQLLLRDITANGSISFRRFYSRRFRRLLPAAFVMLVTTALIYSALASPLEVTQAENGFQASFLYYANWHFITQSSDYFGADLATNPVLHYWSLAVEEQFYLAWPLLLGGLFVLARRAGTRQWHVLRLLVLAGAVASLLWAWSLKSIDPNRAYYGTDTRAYQLLAGALLALTPGLATRLRRHQLPARAATVAALAALIYTASAWTHLDPIERGLAATAITLTLITTLETTQRGLTKHTLSTTPIVYLGKISYGTYLWHWPVIIVINQTYNLSPLTTIAITTLTATALASLSYQLLEQPIRLSPTLDRHRTPVIAASLALSAIAALTLIPTITNRATNTATATPTPNTTGFTPVPDLDFTTIKGDFPLLTNCYNQPATTCTRIQGTGPHILLIGDSHAGMMIPTLTTLAEQNNLTLSVSAHFVCPWQRGLFAITLINPAERLEECRGTQADLYDRVIPELDPDIIVVMNRGYEEPDQEIQYRGPDQKPLPEGSPEFDAWIEERTTRSLAELEAGDRSVVVLEPIPYGPVNPLTCLAESETVQACRMVVDPNPSGVEVLYRQLDRDDDRFWSMDIDQLVCPFLPICDPIVDHQVVRTDWTHLTSTYARMLTPSLEAYLRDNGILDSG